MSSPRISLQYSGDAASGLEPRLLLEQEPVPTGQLSLTDLANMVALVRSGVPASTYIVQSCPASIIAGKVVVPLTLFVWPSLPGMNYSLTAALPAWTEIGEAMAVEQERDFDLVIPQATLVDLPCLAAGLELTWQTPAITNQGVVIDPPPISGYDTARGQWGPITASSGPINRLRLEREVFGVLRVRCRALGYQHTLTLSIPKATDKKLAEIEETITAAWRLNDGSTETTICNLALPACVASLLESCPDDPRRTPGNRSEIEDPEELIPELRYSTCDGLPIGIVRLVRP